MKKLAIKIEMKKKKKMDFRTFNFQIKLLCDKGQKGK